MKEATECFYSKDYQKSKILFEGLLESSTTENELVEVYTYLVKIAKHLNSPIKSSQAKDYLNLLYKLKKFQAFEENFLTLNRGLDIELEFFYFDSLYQNGEIERSLKVAKEISLKLVEQKIYNKLESYLELIESYFKGYLFYDYAKLIYCLEVENYQAASVTTLKIIKKITSSWSLLIEKKKTQKDYLIHLFRMIRSFNAENGEFQKFVLLQKAKLSREFKELNLVKKEVMEFVVLFHEAPAEYYLLTEIIDDEFLGYDLLDYLKTKNIKDDHAYKNKKIKIIEKYKKEKKEPVKNSEVEKSKGVTQEDSFDLSELYKEYSDRDLIEDELALDLHQFVNLTDDSLSEVAFSLIELSHWKSSKEVIGLIVNQEMKMRLFFQYYSRNNDKVEGIGYFSEYLTKNTNNSLYKEVLGYISELYQQLGETLKAQNTIALMNGLEVNQAVLLKALENE